MTSYAYIQQMKTFFFILAEGPKRNVTPPPK